MKGLISTFSGLEDRTVKSFIAVDVSTSSGLEDRTVKSFIAVDVSLGNSAGVISWSVMVDVSDDASVELMLRFDFMDDGSRGSQKSLKARYEPRPPRRLIFLVSARFLIIQW